MITDGGFGGLSLSGWMADFGRGKPWLNGWSSVETLYMYAAATIVTASSQTVPRSADDEADASTIIPGACMFRRVRLCVDVSGESFLARLRASLRIVFICLVSIEKLGYSNNVSNISQEKPLSRSTMNIE